MLEAIRSELREESECMGTISCDVRSEDRGWAARRLLTSSVGTASNADWIVTWSTGHFGAPIGVCRLGLRLGKGARKKKM
jgi:hypothetical protein